MPTNSDMILEMQQITKEFPGVKALDDVTIEIRRGHIHALLGENGAGKSTLVKILDGVYPHGTFQGHIRLDNKTVQFKSPHDAQLKGIGYVPQEIMVIDGLTVAENIFVGHWNDGRSPVVKFNNLFVRSQQLLDRCNIQLDARSIVSSLNASQRQLVMIARALSTNPSLLILDEATDCLTLDQTENLFSILRHLQSQGVTSLFITHKLNEVVDLADRATVLRDGALAADFERHQLNEDDIVAAMVGRSIEKFYPDRGSEVGVETVFRVEKLTVPDPHISGRNIVEDISFSVCRGEILGIGGLVGSGRSETFNALYGRLPHTGKIFVEEQEVCIGGPRDAKKYGIGFLPEDRKQEGLLFNFAIRENVTLSALSSVSRFQLLSKQREESYANQYKQQLSIRAASVDIPVSNLSGGNQQKVVLAKVLLARPRILLLDEPTKGVDVGAKNEIYKLMIQLVSEGMALVLISSELPELLALCDRCIVLAGGRVTDQFAKSEADEHRFMIAATGGRKDGSQDRSADEK